MREQKLKREQKAAKASAFRATVEAAEEPPSLRFSPGDRVLCRLGATRSRKDRARTTEARTTRSPA